MVSAMSFQQAPPFSVPVRFFLTAPLFGAAAGLLLAYTGADLFVSRWQAEALALTHLMTLGWMTMAMCGALLQILPVAAGAMVWRPGWVAGLTHVGLVVGSLLLSGGFLLDQALLFRLAAPLLGGILASYVVAIGIALFRTTAQGASVAALRLAIGALLITVALGTALAAGLGWRLSLPASSLTAVHGVWGLLGWGLVLLAGVSYMVVPMFQMTSTYPARFAKRWPIAAIGACALWTLAVFAAPDSALEKLTGLALCVLAGAFALATFQLQRRRKRKVMDASAIFWRLALATLFAACLAGAVVLALPPGAWRTRLEFLLGFLVLGGIFPAVINGMLYKILPFMVWLHLQNAITLAPSMHLILAESAMRSQLYLYLAGFAVLMAAVVFPPLTVPAGLLLAGSFLWLEINLVRAVRFFHRTVRAGGPAVSQETA